MTTARTRTRNRTVVAVPVAPPSTKSAGAGPVWAIALLLLLGVAYVGLFLSAVVSADMDLLHGLAVAPILFGLTIPIALRIARTDRDPTLATIILAGAATKILMGYVQFKIGYGYFKGRVDAKQYDEAGRVLAPQFRQLDFNINIGKLVGTGYTKVLTGLVYSVAGAGRVAGYMVFAWIGFLGIVLLARAFHIGVPNGASRRYLILLLFLPSLLYWTSSIGKEAPMLLGIGLAAYGIASVMRSRSQGIFPLAGGTLVILLIRPHIALILFGAFAFALLVRRAPARTYAAPMFRLIGIVTLIVLAFFLLSKTSAFLESNLKTSSLSDQLSETQERTTEAGSAFRPATVNTPIDLPWATVTVLFRPFVFEASGLPGLIAAAEGAFLIALFVLSWNRLRSVPKMFRNTPYVAFSIAYVVAFIVAFSRFANFGLLSRQRVQVTPFLLVLVALPTLRELTGAATARAAEKRRAARKKKTGVPRLPAGPVAPSGTRRRLRPPAPTSTPAADRTVVSTGSQFSPPGRSSAP